MRREHTDIADAADRYPMTTGQRQVEPERRSDPGRLAVELGDVEPPRFGDASLELDLGGVEARAEAGRIDPVVVLEPSGCQCLGVQDPDVHVVYGLVVVVVILPITLVPPQLVLTQFSMAV